MISLDSVSLNEYLLSTIFLSQCSITRAYKPNQKRLQSTNYTWCSHSVFLVDIFFQGILSSLDTGTPPTWTAGFTRKRCTTKVAISTSFTNRSTSWGWSWRRIRTSRGWSRRRIRTISRSRSRGRTAYIDATSSVRISLPITLWLVGVT